MGPGFNAVCVVREEQNYKSDPPIHGWEREEEDGEGERRKERQEREAEEGLSYQMRLTQHRTSPRSFHPSIQLFGPG